MEGVAPKKLVLILDGHTYSVLEIETLRETVKAKGEFIVFIAEPSSDIGNHLISLLVEKLAARLPKPNLQREQAGAGQPATRPVDEPEGGDKPQPEAEGRSR